MTRPLYADLSPGRGWPGREPETLEAATATQTSTRTVDVFLAQGLAALLVHPRPIAIAVGGATPSDAPAAATITGLVGGVTVSEVVPLLADSGERVAGAVCSKQAFSQVDQVVFSPGAGAGATTAIGFGLIPGVRDVRGQIAIATMLNLLDLDGDGFVDEVTLDSFAERASNEIDSVLCEPEGNYPPTGPEGRTFNVPPPPKVADLAHDFFLAFLGARYPTVLLLDHQWFAKQADRQLGELRKAYRGVAQSPPAPAANSGGVVLPSPARRGGRPKFVGPGKFGIF